MSKIKTVTFKNKMIHLFNLITHQYVTIDFLDQKFKIHHKYKDDFEKKIDNLMVVAELFGYNVNSRVESVSNKNGKTLAYIWIYCRFIKNEPNDGIVFNIKLSPFSKTFKLAYTGVIGENNSTFTTTEYYAADTKDSVNIIDKAIEML